MTLLSFTKQFALAVENRTKLQTIRNRKIPITVGEKLQLYKGRYAPGERIKMHDAVCLSAEPMDVCIGLDKDGIFCDHIYVSGVELTRAQKDRLATADGFDSYLDFARYFFYGKTLPYPKQLIKWGLPFETLEIGKFYIDGHGNKYQVKDDEWGIYGAELIDDTNSKHMRKIEGFKPNGQWCFDSAPEIENLYLEVAP